MKTFGIYALCVILFFIFSNVMIYVALKASYSPMDTYQTQKQGLEFKIKEAKATYVNGYVGGNITNLQDTVAKTYVKIDLYTKRDVYLGSKYIQIDNLRKDETREFRIGFKYTDADYAKISVVDEVSKEVSEESFVSENLDGAMLIAAVILLCCFG